MAEPMTPDLNRLIGGLRCRDLLPFLADHLEGALSSALSRRINSHLEGCGHCSKFGEEYAFLLQELQSRITQPELDPQVKKRLTNRIEALWASETASDTGETL